MITVFTPVAGRAVSIGCPSRVAVHGYVERKAAGYLIAKPLAVPIAQGLSALFPNVPTIVVLLCAGFVARQLIGLLGLDARAVVLWLSRFVARRGFGRPGLETRTALFGWPAGAVSGQSGGFSASTFAPLAPHVSIGLRSKRSRPDDFAIAC